MRRRHIIRGLAPAGKTVLTAASPSDVLFAKQGMASASLGER